MQTLREALADLEGGVGVATNDENSCVYSGGSNPKNTNPNRWTQITAQ